MSENTNNNTTTSAVASVKPYYQRWRLLKDKLARYGIAFGGLAVIVALVLIFLYLVYVVYPLFLSAHADAVSEYALPEAGQGKTLAAGHGRAERSGCPVYRSGPGDIFPGEKR